MKKISIIIATYNAAKTLKRCLDSIVPQLTDETELIIIDGASKDATNDIINSYGENITVHISEPDLGIYDAWNKGIKISNGEWIMFIGADDALTPNALKDYCRYLAIDGHNDLDFVSAKLKAIDDFGRFISYNGGIWDYKRCRRNMEITHVASITNRKYFERIGLFDIRYKICGDYELLMRGGTAMKAGFVDSIIAIMTIGGVSFSVKGLKEMRTIRRIVGNMNPIENYLIYLSQLLLFRTYFFRHKLDKE